MADTKLVKNRIKRYRNLFLAFVVVIVILSFYSLKNSKENFEQSLEEQNLSPSSINPTMPQYPVIFTSQGRIKASIIYQQPSLYGDIVIFDYVNNLRCFLIDGVNESCWNFQKQTPSTYVRNIKLLLQNVEAERNIKDVLIVGVGAGTLLKDLNNSGYSVEGIEINPKMPEVARDYFLLPKNLDYKIIIDDGRHYLNVTDKKYDAIVLDLCYINQTNVHLWTKEFYVLAKGHLKNPDTGIVIASRGLVTKSEPDRLDKMIANAIQESFDYLYSVERPQITPNEFEMGVFLATNQPTAVSSIVRGTDRRRLHQWSFDPAFVSATDDRQGELLQLFWSATEKIREQTLNNFGERILLPI